MDELGRLSPEQMRQRRKMPVVLVLDNVRSALNVGSAFRTADAFALEKIYLCGITATPPHREIFKTARGAHESVGWEFAAAASEVVNRLRGALEELRRLGGSINENNRVNAEYPKLLRGFVTYMMILQQLNTGNVCPI